MTGDDHTTWHIFTDDPYWIRRLEKVGATHVKDVGEGKMYTFPANQVSVRKPRRELSEEEKSRLAARLNG